MFCSKCGALIKEGQNFCSTCGEKQQIEIKKVEQPAPTTIPAKKEEYTIVQSGAVVDWSEKKHKKRVLVLTILSLLLSLSFVAVAIAATLSPVFMPVTIEVALAELTESKVLGFFSNIFYEFLDVLCKVMPKVGYFLLEGLLLRILILSGPVVFVVLGLVGSVQLFFVAFTINAFQIIGNVVNLIKFKRTYQEQRLMAVDYQRRRRKVWKNFIGRFPVASWVIVFVALIGGVVGMTAYMSFGCLIALFGAIPSWLPSILLNYVLTVACALPIIAMLITGIVVAGCIRIRLNKLFSVTDKKVYAEETEEDIKC